MNGLLLFALPVSAETLTGKAVKVTDRDPISVQAGSSRHRIRLKGIDAPEKDQP
jgi:endonuclease YncB( thermonuclease family)